MTFREAQFRVWCALCWAVIFLMAAKLLLHIAAPGFHDCIFNGVCQ